MTTPNFGLPEWEQTQDQPHATVNEALRIIECLAQLRILDRDLTAPPGSPSDGDCYIPAGPATGDWVGQENAVAMYIGTAWVFRFPKDGWRAYVVDEAQNIQYGGGSPTAWISV